ncbi:MAG: tetratricopeptide repeat protein [Nitrosomonadales bacterium]|nr:tetratricopeptide repeat protein [Nitrosomonadales bacterium]
MADSGNAPRGEQQNTSRARVRDVRLRALALTAVPIIAGGIAIAYLPGWLQAPVADGGKQARAIHAMEKTEAEISQRFRQGVAALNAKQYEQAISDFHRVLELAPEMPEAHVNSGFALIGLERYAVARDFFEGALALRRNQVNAYFGLAEALEGLNDLPGALGAMRTYLHLAPADDPYRRKAQSAVWEWEAKVAEERARGKPVPTDKAKEKR